MGLQSKSQGALTVEGIKAEMTFNKKALCSVKIKIKKNDVGQWWLIELADLAYIC